MAGLKNSTCSRTGRPVCCASSNRSRIKAVPIPWLRYGAEGFLLAREMASNGEYPRRYYLVTDAVFRGGESDL